MHLGLQIPTSARKLSLTEFKLCADRTFFFQPRSGPDSFRMEQSGLPEDRSAAPLISGLAIHLNVRPLQKLQNLERKILTACASFCHVYNSNHS